MPMCSVCGNQTELLEEICEDCKRGSALSGSTNPVDPQIPNGPPEPAPHDNLPPDVSPVITAQNDAIAARSDQEDPTADLKQIYQDFAKPVGRTSSTFGCLALLMIVGGIITGFFVSWLLGILGTIVVVAVVFNISRRILAKHKKRAGERISQLEKQYAVSHQESFDLLFASRSGVHHEDKNEWTDFVSAVWGASALAAIRKQEQLPEPMTRATPSEARVESVFDESNQSDPGKVAAIILECAGMYSHAKLHVAAKIPEKKEQNARVSCDIPLGESVLVLADCTSFGSAKNCLVMTPLAIYVHNDRLGKTPGTFRIPYSEIPSRVFSDGGFAEIGLDQGQFLNIAAGPKKEVLGLLCSARERLTGIAAASSNCPRCQSDLIAKTFEKKSSTAAHIAGQALFGIVGNVIAGAAFARTIQKNECKSCGFKWVI